MAHRSQVKAEWMALGMTLSKWYQRPHRQYHECAKKVVGRDILRQDVLRQGILGIYACKEVLDVLSQDEGILSVLSLQTERHTH